LAWSDDEHLVVELLMLARHPSLLSISDHVSQIALTISVQGLTPSIGHISILLFSPLTFVGIPSHFILLSSIKNGEHVILLGGNLVVLSKRKRNMLFPKAFSLGLYST